MVAGPTVPPPPALLSIVIGWPMNFDALSAIARIAMSVDPPAGQGTIRVIGLVGYSCAPAAVPASAPSVARTIVRLLRQSIIDSLPRGRHQRKPLLLSFCVNPIFPENDGEEKQVNHVSASE